MPAAAASIVAAGSPIAPVDGVAEPPPESADPDLDAASAEALVHEPPSGDPRHDDAAESDAGAILPPPARTLDETVLAVLREEADRETEARRAERAARMPVMETQVEMGLQAAAGPLRGDAERRVARLKGVEVDPPLPISPRLPARRDLLPEIDEINSSLRASSETRSGAEAAIAATMPVVETGRRGFRSGFTLMMAVVAIGAMTYVMAPKIVERLPGAGPAITSYVGAVDMARLRLDASLKALIAALRSVTRNDGGA